jgi:hypothetical protein
MRVRWKSAVLLATAVVPPGDQVAAQHQAKDNPESKPHGASNRSEARQERFGAWQVEGLTRTGLHGRTARSA